jgi:hypothetical protein
VAEVAAPADAGGHEGATIFRSIGELAELCGHYCWVERRLFEVTGSRASRPLGEPGVGGSGAGDAEVRVVLSQMSARHGFFAAQWRDRLPVRAGVEAEALVVPPPGPFGQALDLIESGPGLAHVLGGLVTEILPRLVEHYDRHLAQASPVSEAPVRAVLEWAAVSTGREIRVAGLLLHRLVPGGEGARSVGDFGALVQRLFGGPTDSFPGARAS